MQIADGVLQIWPEGGRAEILDVLSHQFQDGHTVLTWHPYDDTYYSDQPIWLVMGVAGYIKETGDAAILNEIVAYQDGGQGTVWNICWPDSRSRKTISARTACASCALPIGTTRSTATPTKMPSRFLSPPASATCSRSWPELSDFIGNQEFADRCRKKHTEVMKAINSVAWTGEYYTMVHRTKTASSAARTARAARSTSIPRPGAFSGEVVPEDRIPLVCKSMDEKIEHDFGLPVNWPPYDKHSFSIGRMGAFPWGVCGNGGAYCHATGFGIVANAKLGRGDVALRLLKKIMPDSEYNPSSKSGAERYVFTNSFVRKPAAIGWSLTFLDDRHIGLVLQGPRRGIWRSGATPV